MPQEIRFELQTIRGVIEPWRKLLERGINMSLFEYEEYRSNRLNYFLLPNAPIYY